jgi:hypothetical protein
VVIWVRKKCVTDCGGSSTPVEEEYAWQGTGSDLQKQTKKGGTISREYGYRGIEGRRGSGGAHKGRGKWEPKGALMKDDAGGVQATKRDMNELVFAVYART